MIVRFQSPHADLARASTISEASKSGIEKLEKNYRESLTDINDSYD